MPSLKLTQITTEGLQAREKTDAATIAEYAEAYKDGAKFPAVIVYHDGAKYYLADGFHRYFAVEKAGFKDINCDVQKGTLSDARWHAAGANQLHGLKRTHADKHRSVEMALKEKPNSADGVIAKHCGVSKSFVGDIRCSLTTPDVTQTTHSDQPVKPVAAVAPVKRVGIDGKSYKVPARKIVSKPIAPPSNPVPGSVPGSPVPARKPVTPIRPVPPKPSDDVIKGKEVVDQTDLPIPKEILESWNEATGDSIDLCDLLASARKRLSDREKSKHPAYVNVDFTDDLAALKKVITDVERATPYAVCHSCNGKLPVGCQTCKGRGWVEEFFWNTCVPAEIKKLRGGK